MPWAVAIFGAALIGVAVHGLGERSDMDDADDGLDRQARKRKAALLAARDVLDEQAPVSDLMQIAEYIRTGTMGGDAE